MSSPTLGVAMIAQNEVVHLPAAISQFYTVSDDIVLVDGGSTDNTSSWAAKLGARVFERPFDYNFSAQKNYAISKLNTDWIYVHDPDERLDPPLLSILNKLIAPDGQKELIKREILLNNTEPYDCFGIARKNFIDGIQTKSYPDYQYRLFRKYCAFKGKVHEELVGFSNRTEVDYKRIIKESPARYNILHYKSGTRQTEQEVLYDKIERGVLNE